MWYSLHRETVNSEVGVDMLKLSLELSEWKHIKTHISWTKCGVDARYCTLEGVILEKPNFNVRRWSWLPGVGKFFGVACSPEISGCSCFSFCCFLWASALWVPLRKITSSIQIQWIPQEKTNSHHVLLIEDEVQNSYSWANFASSFSSRCCSRFCLSSRLPLPPLCISFISLNLCRTRIYKVSC